MKLSPLAEIKRDELAEEYMILNHGEETDSNYLDRSLTKIKYQVGFNAGYEFAQKEERERAEKLVNALINCRMQFADMMSRLKAPDAWMINELDEALAEYRQGGKE